MPRLQKSFWEKIGFKDKKKEERNLKEAKEKVDRTYKHLKETISSSLDLQRRLEASR